MSEILTRISEAGGLNLTFMGITTVFVTLICIWIFIGVYSKLMSVMDQGKTDTATECSNVVRSNVASKSETVSEPASEPTIVESEITPTDECTATIEDQTPADDVVPRMAAAAAVSVFLKRRKEKLLSLVGDVSHFDAWKSSGRQQALRNIPARNPWRNG